MITGLQCVLDDQHGVADDHPLDPDDRLGPAVDQQQMQDDHPKLADDQQIMEDDQHDASDDQHDGLDDQRHCLDDQLDDAYDHPVAEDDLQKHAADRLHILFKERSVKVSEVATLVKTRLLGVSFRI